MTVIEALTLGILQGATEFLPISSSGHLALAQGWMGLRENQLVFDVVVHVGTLCAIAIVFRKRLWQLVQVGPSLLHGWAMDPDQRADQRWLLLIALASIPTAVIGLLLKEVAETLLIQPAYLGPAFLGTGALLLFSERRGRRDRGSGALGILDALLIGVAQGIAVIPGVSRSGATVSTALARDIEPKSAVEFSLLISMPAVAGAALLTGLQANGVPGALDPLPLLVGFVTALASGLLAVRALQWAVGQRWLLPFALYCAALGAATLAVGAWHSG